MGPKITDWIGAIAAASSTIIAFVAAIIVIRQLSEMRAQRSQQANATLGQFIFQLDEALSRNTEVHQRLRPKSTSSDPSDIVGSWTKGKGPENDADWTKVESYMGIFERMSLLKGKGDLDTIKHLYGYRM